MSKFGFDKLKKEFERDIDEVTKKMAKISSVHFVESFSRQSWDGVKWKEVQRRIQGTNAYKYPKNKGLQRRTKPILVNKGTLRRAVNNSLKSANKGTIIFEINSDYAIFQNEGTDRIDKRQFIGWSKYLQARFINMLKNELRK